MPMKKIICLLLVLFLCGCEKEQIDISYNSTYYKVAMPYKKSVSNYTLNSYDKVEVEKMLMNLSSNYFRINNSLYQDGQYLTTDEIKTLLNEYNDTEEIQIGETSIKPKYITTIYEQNYLSTNDNLKGISLAIVVNNRQYNGNNYKTIDENVVLDYAKEKANELVKYLYNKINTRIIIGIYLESNDSLKGSFKYIGENDKDIINLQYVNYNYRYLDSNYIMNNDMDTYNNILAIKNILSEYTTLYISPIGLYKDTELVSININLTKNNFTRSEILAIADTISNYIKFNANVEINIYFKSNNNIKAYLNKKDNDLNIEVYLVEE